MKKLLSCFVGVSFRLRSRASILGHPSVRRLLLQVIREAILLHYRSRRFDHVELSTSDLIQGVGRMTKRQYAEETRETNAWPSKLTCSKRCRRPPLEKIWDMLRKKASER